MVRFDAYTATTTAANPHQLAALFGDGLTQNQGKGFHQFGHRLSLRDHSGSEVGSVQWGGSHGERTMIEVKGERSPGVVERLRSDFPHRATRLDSCADFDAPGSFQSLLAMAMQVKHRHKLRGRREGDWEDFPELGRTQYIGTPKSVSMLRLYEKGKQSEYLHLDRPDWVRAEIQVRPAKDAKAEFSHLTALEVWGASPWTRELAGLILQEHVDPHSAGTMYRKSSLERKLGFLCRQYGPTLLELHSLLGTWECVGLTLSEKIKELRDATY